MLASRRPFLLWFVAGVFAPLALWGLGTVSAFAGAKSVSRAFEVLALGGCPFWLFLWLPAMSQPTNDVLFYSVAVAVLVANGCLYLVMAQVQRKTQRWRLPLRLVALAVAFPVLMALGYCVPLGLDSL